MHAKRVLFLFCSLLFSVACVVAAKKQCVSLFDSDARLFAKCLTKECIVFRTEVPFVFVDKRMNQTIHQKPFKCSEHSDQFDELNGPFFDIVKALPPLRDALCVWGGNDCSFDDMIAFVNRSSAVGDYKFVAGGLLFSLEYRLSENTIPSVPLLEDKLIIIGPRDDDGRTTWRKAWDALWRPFTMKAWAMIFLTTASIIFLRVWISYHFTVPFSWQQFRDNLLGDYIHTNIGESRPRSASPVERYKDPAELRRLNSYISNGVKILFVIMILYYEIAVVDFIFQARQDAMTRVSPQKFVLTKSSTMSQAFVNEFLNKTEGRKRWGCKGSDPCWTEVDTIQDVYDTITDRNSTKHKTLAYSYVYETFNRYWFQQNASLCNELQVLEFEQLNRKFAGVWYYSSRILLPRRIEIDRAILELREKDGIRPILHEVSGSSLPSTCEISSSISVLLLGVPIFMLCGPIFSLVFMYMLAYTIRLRRERAGREDDEEDQRNESTDSYTGDSTSYETSMMDSRKYDSRKSDSRKCHCFSTSSSDSKIHSRIIPNGIRR